MTARHTPPIVISASRRTDIPAFYMDWFMDRIAQGRFLVENPFNHKVYPVDAPVSHVAGIVFWSKNYGPFLDQGRGEALRAMGHEPFFQFTLNSEDPVAEPGVPPLSERLDQAAELARRFGPERITWRFDPICHYQYGDGPVKNNLHDGPKIAEAMAAAGVTRCVTSFLDLYPKVLTRAGRIPDFAFVDPPLSRRIEIITRLAAFLRPLGLGLSLCCEKELVDRLDPDLGIGPSSCIDHGLIESVTGVLLSGDPDRGQRVRAGCGCHRSRDVGSYREQPCRHHCLYCYAT